MLVRSKSDCIAHNCTCRPAAWKRAKTTKYKGLFEDKYITNADLVLEWACFVTAFLRSDLIHCAAGWTRQFITGLAAC